VSRPIHRQTLGLRIQASLFLAGWLIGPAALILGLVATVQRDLSLLLIAGLLVLTFGILSLIHLIEGGRTQCSLCKAALFGPTRNRKHRHAQNLAGSYKLQVAHDVLRHGRYRCPHCNEHILCREVDENRPKRLKPLASPSQTLPTMRQASPPTQARTTALRGRGDRITEPDDSPTLPS